MEVQDIGLNGVEEIPKLLEETRAVRRQTRWIRIGFVLLILLTIVLFLSAIYSHFKRFDVEKLGEEMAKRAERAWPVIASEIEGLVKNVLPTVEASLMKELEEAGPQIAQRFDQEAQTFENNVKKGIETALKEHLVQANRAQAIKIVQEAFPEYGDEKKVDELVQKLQESFLLYAQKRLLTMLAQYYDTLLGFEKAFNQIKAQIAPDEQPATFDAVLGLWLEVVYQKMGGDSALEVSKPEKGKGKK